MYSSTARHSQCILTPLTSSTPLPRQRRSTLLPMAKLKSENSKPAKQFGLTPYRIAPKTLAQPKVALWLSSSRSNWSCYRYAERRNWTDGQAKEAREIDRLAFAH